MIVKNILQEFRVRLSLKSHSRTCTCITTKSTKKSRLHLIQTLRQSQQSLLVLLTRRKFSCRKIHFTNFNSCSTSSSRMPGESKYKIVFVRHGVSEWNLKNLFCGWFDASLSEAGEKEAKSGGAAIKEAGLKFDQAFTSKLKR